MSHATIALLVTAGLAVTTRAHAEPADFVTDARLFYRIVACADEGPSPADGDGAIDARLIARHCAEQKREIALYRKRFVARAAPFLAEHRPDDLPTAVVYPFGGGDLLSALVTYPDAREITTISLEHAGDPRRLAGLPRARLQTSLLNYRTAVRGLLRNHDSASKALKTLERGPIPGQLSFFIQALAIMGQEPVSLKYFKIQPDGTIQYYTRDDIAALESKRALRKSAKWVDTDYSVAFSHMELGFRERGAGPDAPVRIHRHIAANLNNDRFAKSPLRAHLEAKGKVAAMTKAASYLLWNDYFSAIRSYLLDHMVFMISDSTGIPPRFARKAGFEQITFGRFKRAYLDTPAFQNQAFRQLWSSQPHRPLTFRYGYWDGIKQFHLMITRPRQ